MRRLLLDDGSAHLLHHVDEMNAGRARRLTCAAVQTPKHVLDEGVGYLCPAFIKCTHQVNAATRRIHLAAQHPVRGTRRETQTAMDAVQIERSFLHTATIFCEFCAFLWLLLPVNMASRI